MNTLLALDYRLFFAVNHLPHTAWSNAVAEFFSGIGSYGIIWFVIGVILFLREEEKNHRFFIPIVTVGLGTLALVEGIMKPLIGRLRPSQLLDTIVVYGASGYSFPSGHAAISFAMAEVISVYEPRLRTGLYLLAILISLSRIYMGVHYPLDVLFGALFGWGIGRASVSFVTSERAKSLRHRSHRHSATARRTR